MAAMDGFEKLDAGPQANFGEGFEPIHGEAPPLADEAPDMFPAQPILENGAPVKPTRPSRRFRTAAGSG